MRLLKVTGSIVSSTGKSPQEVLIDYVRIFYQHVTIDDSHSRRRDSKIQSFSRVNLQSEKSMHCKLAFI